MELSVFDRLILLNILPTEGDITTIRIIRDMRSSLSFSEDEHKALQFRKDGGQVHWITEADKPVNIEIGLKATEIIRDSLKALNDKKKLQDEHLNLWEKFMDNQ